MDMGFHPPIHPTRLSTCRLFILPAVQLLIHLSALDPGGLPPSIPQSTNHTTLPSLTTNPPIANLVNQSLDQPATIQQDPNSTGGLLQEPFRTTSDAIVIQDHLTSCAAQVSSCP